MSTDVRFTLIATGKADVITKLLRDDAATFGVIAVNDFDAKLGYPGSSWPSAERREWHGSALGVGVGTCWRPYGSTGAKFES
jgi:hypothetical protein